MARDKEIPLWLIKDRISTFVHLKPVQGVNNFLLAGPSERGLMISETFAAVFSSVSRPEESSLVLIHNSEVRVEPPAYYYNRILGMALSPEILRLGIADDDAARRELTEACRRNYFPFQTLTFAHYVESGNEMVVMHAINGISPQTALTDFQSRAGHQLNS